MYLKKFTLISKLLTFLNSRKAFQVALNLEQDCSKLNYSFGVMITKKIVKIVKNRLESMRKSNKSSVKFSKKAFRNLTDIIVNLEFLLLGFKRSSMNTNVMMMIIFTFSPSISETKFENNRKSSWITWFFEMKSKTHRQQLHVKLITLQLNI